jgi:hypothetical protein
VDPTLAEIERNIGTLSGRTTSADARTQYAAAMSELNSLSAIDRKAREHFGNGEQLVTLDVVLTDQNTSVQQLTAALNAASDAERLALDARLREIRTWRLGIEAGAMALLILVAVVLGWRKPRKAVEPAVEAPSSKMFDVDIRPSDAPAKVEAPAPAGIDLGDAANVCVDLARVLDGRDMPPLLMRVADVLGAKGLVLWVVDTTGTRLQPSIGHGYSDRLLSRMGRLEIDADNITSRAFRSLQPQVLNREGGTGNALAVPLITASGAVGVLAAELDASATGRDALPLARMFAAQLSTLVGPTAEPAAEAAQG